MRKFIYLKICCIALLCSTSLLSFAGSNEKSTEPESKSKKVKEVTISGKVTSEGGEELVGVNIVLKGTTIGTITDVSGNYSLKVPDQGGVLIFSFIGYVSREIQIGNQTTINVSLVEDIKDVGEVIVVGYGVQKKSVVTGAIAKIDAQDLKASKDLRVEQAMQGKTAGVVIMNNSGQPGDNLTIRIRGTGTNGDPDPLFLVDGLPMEKEGLDYLNPTDIESIEVLKDAASAAIYGTRGANGVVIITTKQGKKNQKFTVSYDGYYGVQNPWRKLKMLNTQQYVDIINEASKNDGASPYFSDEKINSFNADTDWQKEMLYRNAPKSNHTVSFAGGNANAIFSSSLNYFTQDGIVAKGKSNFDRITYRLNTSYDFGKITIGSNINLVNIKSKGIEGNSQFGTGITQALNMPPIVPVRHEDGRWAVPNDFGIGLQEITNPIAMLSYLHRNKTTNKALGNIYGELEIIKGLTFRTNYGAEFALVKEDEFYPAYNLDPTHLRLMNGARKNLHIYSRWNWDNTLSYTNNIGKHNFNILGGITRFKEWNEGINASKDSLIFDSFDNAYLDNSIQTTGRVGNEIVEHTLQSYFGRLNYNYNEKYLLEGVLRVDGSSRFGINNRYGYFPAVSAGWVFTKEAFFPVNPYLNFGKLRASWGRNGNENIGNFRYTSIMQRRLYYFFGNDQKLYDGIQPDFYPNPNLKWETSQQTDIGIDLGLFSNKLTFTMDYYDKRTKDWLIDNAPFPRRIGNTPPIINGGEVQNRGYEFELGYKDQIKNGLNYNFKFTAATNKSKMISINNASGSFSGGQGSVGQNNILRAAEGEPLGYFWAYVNEGVFKSEAELDEYPHQSKAKVGDLKFKDVNGDGKLDDLDRQNVGLPYPKLILGLITNLEWKGFDLNMFFYSALGHQIWMANRRTDLIYANYSTDILGRYNDQNTTGDIPRVTLSDPNETWKRPSDFFVKDADFIRLKNITLGYNLPVKIGQKLGVQRLRIYVTSENLLTITKYKGMEVEVGGGGPLDVGIDHGVYPQSKTFIGGLSITL